MRSRRVLYRLLALASIFPLLEANSGCSFEPGRFPGSGPIAANAVACDCTVAAGGTRTVRVVASAHDAEQDGLMMDLTGDDLDLGQKHVGLRFDRVGLPAGATITSAHVQFHADASQGGGTTVTIQAELAVDGAPFTTTDADITTRLPGTGVPWTIDPWANGDAGAAQRTPDLSVAIQELVALPDWTSASPIVLRISGVGHRTAESFDQDENEAPELVVTYDTTVMAQIPACATELTRDAAGYLASPEATCNELATTLSGLNDACGLPQPVSCTVVDKLDPNGLDIPDSFQAASCEVPCTGNEVDAACTEYDPVALAECVAGGTATFEACKNQYAAATHAGTDTPICVASGSPLAFHAFGQRSLCEVAGTSEILVGDREPKKNPKTAGHLEILGRCEGGGCAVHPSFQVDMEPITFEVRWASDPTFGNLGAAGAGLETALLESGNANFASDTVEGTGTGRRGGDSLAIPATNSDPLDVGIDFEARLCDMVGTLEVGVGDDGVCEADGATVCRSDADCAGVGGGACLLPPDDGESMSIALALGGDIVNQPPTAAAGADQTVECTGTAGASFVLDGRGSSDPEPNLALASWRLGTRTGTELSNDLVTTAALGIGGTQSYVLRVIDDLAQLDEDTTTVSVVDTTPPSVACNAPATIQPPNAEAGLAFTATASDVCDAEVGATVTSYDCFTLTKKGRRVSKLESCIVSFAGDTLTVHDVGGYGDRIAWTVEATDDSGNLGTATCEVVVAK